MAEETEKRRADARANRDRILAVAWEALAGDPDVSLHAIAKAAGVGQGTLYRHFPTREALILGVYHREIDDLVALAPVLLARHPPLAAFRLWCDRFVEYGRRKQAISAMVHAAMTQRDFKETYWPMVETVRRLMTACEAANAIRPGADAEDILQLLSHVAQTSTTPDGMARTRRLIALMFRGLGAED